MILFFIYNKYNKLYNGNEELINILFVFYNKN